MTANSVLDFIYDLLLQSDDRLDDRLDLQTPKVFKNSTMQVLLQRKIFQKLNAISFVKPTGNIKAL